MSCIFYITTEGFRCHSMPLNFLSPLSCSRLKLRLNEEKWVMSIKSFVKLFQAIGFISLVFGCAPMETTAKVSAEFGQLKIIRSGSLSNEELSSAIWETQTGTINSDTVAEMINTLQPEKTTTQTNVSALLTVLNSQGWDVVQFQEQFVFHHEILSQRTTYLLKR